MVDADRLVFLFYREDIELKDLKQDQTETPISRLKYDMDDGTLRSRNRQGWAPPKDRSRGQNPSQRPFSYSGA